MYVRFAMFCSKEACKDNTGQKFCQVFFLKGLVFNYLFSVILKVVPSPTTDDFTKILPLW